jgi:hypothetical protein
MSIGRTNHRGIGKSQIVNTVTDADYSSNVGQRPPICLRMILG